MNLFYGQFTFGFCTNTEGGHCSTLCQSLYWDRGKYPLPREMVMKKKKENKRGLSCAKPMLRLTS